MKILVTGGAGFIGSHIVDLYIANGHAVVIIDNLCSGVKENINPKARFYKADITDIKKIKQIFEKERFDVVNHHAAQRDVGFSIANPLEDVRINVLGSVNILKNAVDCGVKKFIYANSGGASYGNVPLSELPIKEGCRLRPSNYYGLNKSLIELYLKMYQRERGIDFVSLRYSNVFGERQGRHGEAGVLSIFIKKMLDGETPHINGDGKQTRDLVYVRDVANANLLALKKLPSNYYNISSGHQTSILHLYNTLAKVLGFKKKPVFKEALPAEVRFSCLDNSKAKREMGWVPKYNFEMGIKNTVDFFRNM
jgi:UDP-glucose 4-epimerase